MTSTSGSAALTIEAVRGRQAGAVAMTAPFDSLVMLGVADGADATARVALTNTGGSRCTAAACLTQKRSPSAVAQA